MKSLLPPKRPLLGLPSTKSPPANEPSSAGNPATPETSSGATKLLSVPIADITYSGSYRERDENHVADLQESIGRIGLTVPISLATGASRFVLIAGQHRLEAARRLGWTHINAIAFNANESDNRLIALSENLHRLELCVLDRAELQYEWLQAIRDQAGQLADPAGRQQPHDRGISKASRQTDVSAKQIRRSEAIANISPEAKAKARELGLHDNQSALLKIAEAKTASEQLKIASELVERKRKPRTPKSVLADNRSNAEQLLPGGDLTSAESDNDGGNIPPFLNRRDPEKEFQNLCAAWNTASQLKMAWADAPSASRSRFVAEVLCITPSERSEEVSYVH